MDDLATDRLTQNLPPPRSAPAADAAPDPTWLCAVMAGFGGTLPTLSKLAAALVAEGRPVLPEPSFFGGVVIYFVVGALIGCAFKERTLHRALVTGIAAPAIIAGVVAGSAQKQPAQQANAGLATPTLQTSAGATSVLAQVADFLIPSAQAQSRQPTLPALPALPADCGDTQALANASPGGGYRYQVNIRWSGATDWQFGTANTWVLRIRCKVGQTTREVPANLSSFTFETTQPVTDITFDQRKGKPSSIELPPDNQGGAVNLNIEIETKRDIYWALGGHGLPRARSADFKFDAKADGAARTR